MRLAISIAAVFALGAACGDKKKDDGKGLPPASATDARKSRGTPGKGLNAPDNERDSVILAQQVMETCKWTRMGYPLKCSARKAWDGSTFINREPTLVNMLDDPRAQVRWLAAQALRKHKGTHTSNKAQAERIVAAAERERVNTIAPVLAAAVAKLDLDETGLRARVEALITKHPLMRMSGMLARFALATNPGLYEFMTKVARTDKRRPVRRAAVSAFWTGTPAERMGDSCKLWLEISADADAELAGDATNYLFWAPKAACKEHYDAALKTVAAKAKAGGVKATMLANALGSLLGQKTLSSKHKSKALELSVSLLSGASNSRVVRTRMVDVISRHHPKAKTILAKFEKDGQAMVRAAVKRAMERLTGKTK